MSTDIEIEAHGPDVTIYLEPSQALVTELHNSEPRLFSDPRIRFTEIGLVLPEGMDIHDWLGVGSTLKLIEGGLAWSIGDWLNYGERAFGEMYSQALDDTGLDYQTLATYKWVASIYPREIRNPVLSFSHHRVAAALQGQAREALLTEAQEEKWSKERTAQEAKRRKAETDPFSFTLPPADRMPQQSSLNLYADYEVKGKVRDSWSQDERATWYACLLDLWYARAGSRELDQGDYMLIYEPGDFVLAFQKARKELGK